MKQLKVRKLMPGRYAAYDGSTGERVSGIHSSIDRAQMRADQLNRELEKRGRSTERKCMCCRAAFQSEGIHNRLCDRCKNVRLGKEMVGPCTLPS